MAVHIKDRVVRRNMQITRGCTRVEGQHYLFPLPSPILLVKTLELISQPCISSLSSYLLYHNLSFLLKELPTYNDFPAPHVKTKHLTWASGSKPVPDLLSALSLIISFSQPTPEGLWSIHCFPECRTMIQNDFRWNTNTPLNHPGSPQEQFMQLRILSQPFWEPWGESLCLMPGSRQHLAPVASLCNKERRGSDDNV